MYLRFKKICIAFYTLQPENIYALSEPPTGPVDFTVNSGSRSVSFIYSKIIKKCCSKKEVHPITGHEGPEGE
jgi:hypothetical protein